MWKKSRRTHSALRTIRNRLHTLQHTATTHSNNTLQHTATHCNTLQHTATYCNILQHTATHCNAQCPRTTRNWLHALQHTATTRCSALQQHAATRCNRLQHTATHCNTQRPRTIRTRLLNDPSAARWHIVSSTHSCRGGFRHVSPRVSAFLTDASC